MSEHICIVSTKLSMNFTLQKKGRTMKTTRFCIWKTKNSIFDFFPPNNVLKSLLSYLWLLANCCIPAEVYTAARNILNYATCQSKTLTKHGISINLCPYNTWAVYTGRLMVEYQGTISVIGKTNCRREDLKPSFNIRVIYLSAQSHLTGAASSAFVRATHPAKLDNGCAKEMWLTSMFYWSVVLFSVMISADYALENDKYEGLLSILSAASTLINVTIK